MRRIDTIQYIGLWEQLNNPNFNRVEFDTFRNEAGHNYFTMTPKKWIDGVNAIGIISKAGKYNGGTYAHKDIALQFASWISPEINLYIIKEFQRLKADEQKQIGWTVKRELAKINYCIHTDAIKDNIIIPLEITKEQASRKVTDLLQKFPIYVTQPCFSAGMLSSPCPARPSKRRKKTWPKRTAKTLN